MNINSFKNYNNLNGCYTPAVQPKITFQSSNDRRAVGQKQKKYDNPVNPFMEYLNATTATILAGIAFAARVMLELDFDFSAFSEKKNKSVNEISQQAYKKGLNKNLLAFMVIPVVISLVYIAFKLPKNLNKKRKEIFVEKKEFDVYSRSNSAEKNMLERLAKQIKEAKTPGERDKLSKQYALLKMSHQTAPIYKKNDGPIKALSDGFFAPERVILNKPGN